MSLLERLSSHKAASGSGPLQHQHRPSLALLPCPHGVSSALVCRTRHCKRIVAHSSPHKDQCTPSTLIPVAEEAATQQRIEDLNVKTRYIAETLLPTRHGKFRLRGYKHSLDGGITFTEPTAIIAGQVEGRSDVPLRVHDACFTSEVLGSLKCDCAEQLELALEHIQTAGCGMIIYLQQEGRGIGLANKIAAYALQEQGLDTVDANRALGLPDDCREYTSVRNILRDLQVDSIQLMTNNPRKLDVLTQLGVKITGRIPCQVAAGQYNESYLETKRTRMNHLLAPIAASVAAAAAAAAAGPRAALTPAISFQLATHSHPPPARAAGSTISAALMNNILACSSSSSSSSSSSVGSLVAAEEHDGAPQQVARPAVVAGLLDSQA